MKGAIVAASFWLLFGPPAASAQTQTDPAPTFANGFAVLASTLGEEIGSPLQAEQPGTDEPDSIIQPTSNGLLYWSRKHVPTFFDGWRRAALEPDGSLVRWTGADLDPPMLEIASVGRPAGLDYASYIASHSRYGWRAACVSRIETGGWTAFYNPTPVGRAREHAQGFMGWLPSTFASVARPGARIMNLDDEIAAFDRMLDAGRGNEFAGVLAGLC